MSQSLPFHQIQKRIEANLDGIMRSHIESEERKADACQVLQLWGDRNEEAEHFLSQVIAKNQSERLVLPHQEPWGQAYDPPKVGGPMIIAGCDGSQIAPSRENPHDYMVVHVAAIVYSPESIATVTNRLRFLIGDELWRDGERCDSDYTELIRDVDERCLLSEVATDQTYPIIALFDGPIELFRAPGKTPGRKAVFTDYLHTLADFAQAGVVLAGYVDAAEAAMVVRSLEILHCIEQQIDYHQPHLFQDLQDIDLFGAYLRPGQRSAIVRIHSLSSDEYENEVELFGFYIKVMGDYGTFVARIEIPRYVADCPEMVDQLHAAIIEQSKQCAYPLCLLRAHEEAVITAEDKAFIDSMITSALLRVGIRPRPKPPKAHFKGQIR